MNRLMFLISAIALSSTQLFAKTVVNVAENTFKIEGTGGEKEFYYGFAQGDQLIFNFEEVNGKELKEVEITELPSSSKFMDYKKKKIKNKIITVQRTGIYKFRFSNAVLGDRICKMKIQRIPASDLTKNFNSSVYWKTVQDTTYTPTTERFLVKSDTIAQEIYSGNPQISSQNALNRNKNSQVIDFTLPDNTISWSFYIGTGREGKAEYEKVKSSFIGSAANLISKISNYGPLAALALTGVSYFKQVQGEDNVKYWFLTDANNVALFNAGKIFHQYKKGDVINEASQMKYPLKGKVYLALLNDNTIDPIVVTVKVAAIQVKQEWNTRVKQVMRVINREEPYLKSN